MRKHIRIFIDILMTILLFMLNGYQFFSESMHEWLGIGLLVCFIAHNVLNINWYKTLNKGRYSAVRKIYIVVNLFVLFSMLVQMYSGIAMSRHVFRFLDLGNSMISARRLHILGAYWGFLFISLHLGLHWGTLTRKLFKKCKDKSKYLFILASLIAVYGIYAFIKRNFITYLFLRNEFVFMDFNEFPLFFYLDYCAIMGLCIYIAHYGTKMLMKRKKV